MKVELCFGRYCLAAGAEELARELERQGVGFEKTECRSMCPHAPVMFIDRRAWLKASKADIPKLKR